MNHSYLKKGAFILGVLLAGAVLFTVLAVKDKEKDAQVAAMASETKEIREMETESGIEAEPEAGIR